MTTEDDFHAALDAEPKNWHARLVFADFLQELGDARAEGYRAMGVRRRTPVIGYDKVQLRWWDASSGNPPKGSDDLPRDWLDLIAGGQRSEIGIYVMFPTRRAAEDAAARAFAQLPPERRAELLVPARRARRQ